METGFKFDLLCIKPPVNYTLLKYLGKKNYSPKITIEVSVFSLFVAVRLPVRHVSRRAACMAP